jgi:hypothetical protein
MAPCLAKVQTNRLDIFPDRNLTTTFITTSISCCTRFLYCAIAHKSFAVKE